MHKSMHNGSDTPRYGQTVVCALIFIVLAMTVRPQTVLAQAANNVDQSTRPTTFLKLTSPLNEAQFGRVQQAALNLRREADQQDRQALLILEIPPGTTQFHQVYGLARLVTSPDLARVKTVAWIPETVTGNNVLLALACQEIVMHPEAELGDIGRGVAVAADEQQQVLTIIEKGRNPKVNSAVARVMMDPQQQLYRIRVKPRQDAPARTEFVTQAELKIRQDQRAIIENTRSLIESGSVGLFRGQTARADWDVVAAHTAEKRAELSNVFDVPLSALRDTSRNQAGRKVWLIEVNDAIDEVNATFVQRQIARAVGKGADIIIFRITSPGGLLTAMERIQGSILDLPEEVRSVAYVPERALSAAALIAMSCDEVYLAEEAIIGDAGPVAVGDGVINRAPEKVVSYMRQVLAQIAERKNRPAALLMAMADKDLEVYEVRHRDTGRIWYMSEDEIQAAAGEWIKGNVVPESKADLLLTVSGERAHELKIAEPPVADMDELKQRLGVTSETPVVVMGESWVDKLVFKLNDPRWWGTLLTFALLFLFIELHLFTGFFAIASALCFALFFWSRFMGGTAGWLEVILFGLGAVSLALEVFVIPGFGVFGIFGGLSLLFSIVMASQDFGHLEPGKDLTLLTRNVTTMSLSVVAVVVIAAAINRFLPHVPMLRGMILAPPTETADGPRLRPDEVGTTGSGIRVGDVGTARTILRPSGKVMMGDQLLDVVSNGDFIAAGTPVEVVSVQGSRVVVRGTKAPTGSEVNS